jgi:mRNA interferase MazF
MATRPKVSYPRRGEIWLVDLEPTRGAEIKKTRPALIIQNDIGNRASPLTIVAPISSKFSLPLYPIQVRVNAREGGLTEDSVVLLNQIRSIDKTRLVKRVGRLTAITMQSVDVSIRISLGLTDL